MTEHEDYMIYQIKIPMDVFEEIPDMIYMEMDALETELRELSERIEAEWV